jgi:hypothetical protein
MSLSDGLVAFWRMEESSGTRADEVGSIDLTDNNTVTQATGKIGNAAQFTAANSEYLSSTSSSLSTGGGSFSVAAWVYLDTIWVNNHAVSKGVFGDNGNEFRLGVNDSNKAEFIVYNGNDAYTIRNNDTSVTEDAWHLLVGVYDAAEDELSIYLDNISGYTAGSIPSPNSNSNPFVVGRGVHFSAAYFDGRIDAIGFWSRALTSEELDELWNAGDGLEYPFPLPPQTISPGSIASAEVFGSLKANLRVGPQSVVSAEAFGNPAMLPGGVIIQAAAIASLEAFGSVRLNLQTRPNAIASGEAFGVLKTRLYVLPVGIASLEAVGSPALLLGPTSVNPQVIASAESFGNARLNVRVVAAGIASAESVPSPKLNLSIAPSAVASLETFGATRINLRIFPAGLVSGESVGSPLVQGGATLILPAAIASAEAFGSPAILRGGVLILPAAIASQEGLGSIRVNQQVRSQAIGSVESFGSAKLNLQVRLQSADTAEAFGVATLNLQSRPGAISSAEAFGTLHVTPGSVAVLPGAIASLGAFGSLTLYAWASGFVFIAPSDVRTFTAVPDVKGFIAL